jgi:hypothetical protein
LFCAGSSSESDGPGKFRIHQGLLQQHVDKYLGEFAGGEPFAHRVIARGKGDVAPEVQNVIFMPA